MLRASVAHVNGNVELRAISQGADLDAGLPFAAELLALADAAVRDLDALEVAREALRRAGGTAMLIDAAAVIANFEMMTRVADTTGAAVDETRRTAMAPMLASLGVDAFDTARWG